MKAKCKACLLGLLFPVLLQGQEIGLLRMTSDSLESRGSAAVWGGIEEGQFRPVHGASLQWSAGAEANTVRHGKKSSWMGALSFGQTTGYHMNSSMLLEPDYYPLDILEVPQGTKSRQDVRLEGGFLMDFGYELAAGIKASAQGAHVSKQQNIRHSDLGLDLQAEPVLTYVMDDDMGLVSSYIVRFRTEKLEAWNDDTSYSLFLDKGLRYGSYLANSGFRIQEFSHGFNELLHSPEFNVGLSIIWKRGQAGATGSELRFPGSTLSAFGEQTIQADVVDHTYRVSYKRMRDQLRETATNGGIIGLSDRRVRNLDLKYEAKFLHGVLKSVGVVLDGNQWYESASVVSPLNIVRRYDETATLLTAFSYGPVDLDLNFMAGRGWWKDRGREEGSGEPVRLTDNWLRKMDYLMVPRTGLGGTLTCRIPAVQGLYLQLYGYWHHAFQITYLPGKNREIGKLTIGYNF